MEDGATYDGALEAHLDAVEEAEREVARVRLPTSIIVLARLLATFRDVYGDLLDVEIAGEWIVVRRVKEKETDQ